MNGVLVLDKPGGITSQAAVNKVNRILRTKRAGHTGTLDPFATGVLPICVNNATKIIPFLNNDYKKYEALIKLGIKTDTLDLTGKVVERGEVGIIKENALLDVFSKYKGKINQIPPMYSALKKDGVRLYEYARKGIEVDRPARSVVIKELGLLELNPPFVRIMVECSRGTYIRVLASDIADELGCGGHLTELRRIESDGFKIEDAVTIEEIKKGTVELTSLGDALSHMGQLNVSAELAKKIKDGKQIIKKSLKPDCMPAFNKGDRLRTYEDANLVSIAEAMIDSSDINSLDDSAIVLKLLRVFN
ncbi:MAG: tRNA pseudouridine(55) synthase TruB [Deltaproteobacteria bacterium]